MVVNATAVGNFWREKKIGGFSNGERRSILLMLSEFNLTIYITQGMSNKMNLIMENWRNYLDEAYLDDYKGYEGRKTALSLRGPLEDNPGMLDQAKNTLKNILMLYAVVDDEGNISTDPDNIKHKYFGQAIRMLPKEWVKGNIEDPQLKSLSGDAWRPLSAFTLVDWHQYKKNKLRTLTLFRRYLAEGDDISLLDEDSNDISVKNTQNGEQNGTID